MDLSQIPMEGIRGCLLTRLALTLMKAVQEGRVLEWMDRFGILLLDLRKQPGKVGQFQALLRYLFQAEASAPSTFRELAVNVMGAGIKEEVMTIEQQIRQEGWKQGLHEGQQQGTLIGQIQNCQELLGLSVMDIESLARKDHAELESLLQQLKSSLRSRVGH